MKQKFIAAVVIGLASTAMAQLSLHKVSLHAKSVSSGGASDTANSLSSTAMIDSSGSSYTHKTNHRAFSQNHQTTVQCKLRNMGGKPEKVKLQWFFIGAPVGNSSVDVIVGTGEKDIELQPRQFIEETVTHSPTQSHIESTVEYGVPNFYNAQRGVYYRPRFSRSYSGTKTKGWVVRIIDKNEVVDSVGSTDRFKQLGYDSEKLENMLSKS